MKYFIVLLFFLGIGCLTINAQEEIVLHGVVVEQNSKFNTGQVNYLANVEIKALGNSTLSDAKGQFKLVFVDKPIGSVVRVFANKHGYEVANEEVLKRTAILGREQPLKIVMCEDGKLYENQMRYYEIARNTALESHKKYINILKKENAKADSLIAQMEIDFNQTIENVDQANKLLLEKLRKSEEEAKYLADKFVTVNLDNQSETYQKAFRAFIDKNIEEALIILSSSKINMGQEWREMNIIYLEKQAIVYSLYKLREKKYEFYKRKYEFYKRKDELEKRKDSLHKLCDKINSYSLNEVQNKEIKRKDKLYKLYDEIDELSDEIDELSDEIDELSDEIDELSDEIDELSDEIHELEDAQQILLEVELCLISSQFTRVEELCERFLEKEKENTQILSRYALFLKNQNEYTKSLIYYRKLENIQRQLVREDLSISWFDLATTLNHIANIQKARSGFYHAEQTYQEALMIRRKLAKENPQIYLPDLAITLNNLANLRKEIHDFDTAKEMYQEALTIRRELAKKKRVSIKLCL